MLHREAADQDLCPDTVLYVLGIEQTGKKGKIHKKISGMSFLQCTAVYVVYAQSKRECKVQIAAADLAHTFVSKKVDQVLNCGILGIFQPRKVVHFLRSITSKFCIT